MVSDNDPIHLFVFHRNYGGPEVKQLEHQVDFFHVLLDHGLSLLRFVTALGLHLPNLLVARLLLKIPFDSHINVQLKTVFVLLIFLFNLSFNHCGWHSGARPKSYALSVGVLCFREGRLFFAEFLVGFRNIVFPEEL
jgi:hypothetical protein